jgi:mono/diheme cytochrome c family protein
LAVSLVVILVAVACGRATEEDINAALGITPSPTLNAEEVAAATGTAAALATSRAQIAASPAGTGGDAAVLLAGGDITRGQVVFLQNCQSCHGGAPTAPNLMQPNPDVDLSPEHFLAVVRNGEGHEPRPGPFGPQRISDESLRNLYAFILSRVQP